MGRCDLRALGQRICWALGRVLPPVWCGRKGDGAATLLRPAEQSLAGSALCRPEKMHRRTGYPLLGWVPAEPNTVSLGGRKARTPPPGDTRGKIGAGRKIQPPTGIHLNPGGSTCVPMWARFACLLPDGSLFILVAIFTTRDVMMRSLLDNQGTEGGPLSAGRARKNPPAPVGLADLLDIS